MYCTSREFHRDRIDVLASYGWLAGAPPQFVDALFERARWKQLKPGDRITTAGDNNGELVALAEGAATLSTNIGGSDTALVHVFRPPVWFGYANLIDCGPRRFTTVMRTPGWILSVDGQSLEQLLDSVPGSWRIFAKLGVRYGDLAAALVADLLVRKSENRIISFLLRCSGHRDPTSGPPLSCVPLTQLELAEATGLSRNTVLATLQNLVARRLITLSRGRIRIDNPSVLIRLLHSDD